MSLREFVIKSYPVDLVQQTIRTFIDSPHLSNRQVAKQLGISEFRVRYWKKQDYWETEKQKIISDRAEEMQALMEQDREKYKRKLQEQQEKLEVMRDGLINSTAHAVKLTSKAYKKFSDMDDPVKGCSSATKSGVHLHSRVGMDGMRTIAFLNDQIYQIGIVAEHLENLKEEEEDEL